MHSRWIVFVLAALAFIISVKEKIALLQNEPSANRQMQLLSACMEKHDYTHAAQTLDGLQQYPELARYCALQSSLIYLAEQNKTLYDIKNNSSLYQSVKDFANDSLTPGASSARSILTLINGVHYAEVIKYAPESTSAPRNGNKTNTLPVTALRNYPNPFSSGTVIEATVSENTPAPVLVVYDVLGNTVSSYPLHTGSNSLNLDAGSLKPGIYFYSVVSNNKRIATQKMVCTQ